MLLICKSKVIDLNKFETVRCRASLTGDGFPVEATRHENGFLGPVFISEEIIRFENADAAKRLMKDITRNWIKKRDVFDVVKWLKDNKSLLTKESVR